MNGARKFRIHLQITELQIGSLDRLAILGSAVFPPFSQGLGVVRAGGHQRKGGKLLRVSVDRIVLLPAKNPIAGNGKLVERLPDEIRNDPQVLGDDSRWLGKQLKQLPTEDALACFLRW